MINIDYMIDSSCIYAPVNKVIISSDKWCLNEGLLLIGRLGAKIEKLLAQYTTIFI